MCGFTTLTCVVRVPCLAGTLLLLLALAGCGSTNKAATATAASSVAAPTAATSGAAQAVKTATYKINLAHVTGSSGGANVSGNVILSVKAPSDELCWSISPVKNFTISTSTTEATIVTIQRTPSGTPSTPGIPLGFAYKSAGCVHEPSIFLGRLQAQPQMFYLSIYDTQSGDAVRGQI
jgi:hypothetical protein